MAKAFLQSKQLHNLFSSKKIKKLLKLIIIKDVRESTSAAEE